MTKFSPEIYRKYNLDLQHLSDEDLAKHFSANQGEPRLYGPTENTAEFLSMRWLRGNGIEFGAGNKPTPCFGNAQAEYGDVDTTFAFGGQGANVIFSVDDTGLPEAVGKKYDFAIASHVLEHCDSFIRAVENLCSIIVPGGIVYLVLPDVMCINDHKWMPLHNFEHHLMEYKYPLTYAEQHMKDYANAHTTSADVDEVERHATLSADYIEGIRTGNIPKKYWFMHHKHTYKYSDWLDLILKVRDFLKGRVNIEILDSRYGHERKDCHFVISSRVPNEADSSIKMQL